MTAKYYLTLIATLIFNCLSVNAQNDTSFLPRAATLFQKWTDTNPQEKVYLHLDKSSYELYDTVWYKAYTVIGAHHQLSILSAVLYVELISPGDSVLTRQILHLNVGIAWGQIALPVNLKPGDYHIRAYTNWMRNAGAAYFYNQKIHIGGYEAIAAPKQVAQTNPDVQFCPEGGQLINGLRSRIAVKAVNTAGYGQDIKGTIEDNQGNVIVDFATQHLGMGMFAFTPQSGKIYKAKIISGETPFLVNLPKAKDSGFTLSINNSRSDSIFVRLAVNEPTFKEKQHSAFYLIAQSGGKIYYTATCKLEDMSFSAAVDKKRFPTGITQFSLFSGTGEPLNERTVFIRSDDTLQLHANALAKTYNVRQKVTVVFSAKNTANRGAMGAFSAAVINESFVPADETAEGTILNNLLLTSDLKGYIEQPNYYFNKVGEQTNTDLDILMLTQGFERYEWRPILTGETPANVYQPEKLLELNGTIKTLSGKPVANGKIVLVAIKENLLSDTVADGNGKFKFTNLDFSDSAKLVLNAKKANDSPDVTMLITEVSYPPVVKQPGMNLTTYSGLFNGPVNKPDTDIAYRKQILTQLKNRHQLKEVTIRGRKIYKRKEPDLSNSQNLNGPGEANQVILMDSLKGCAIFTDCLTGVMKRVTFRGGKAYDVRHPGSPMVLIVDGSVELGTEINDLNANVIYSIEVLRSPQYLAIYGGTALAGALVITTKRGNNFLTAPTPGTLRYTFHGFYKGCEFYAPKYNVPKAINPATDLRTTIYWNPNVLPDKNGEASFEFFNADTKGTYRVVIEGIDDDGNLGRAVYRYKVE
jgi:hypothetical protein